MQPQQQHPPHQHHHQQHMLRVSQLPPTPMSSTGSVAMPRVQWVRTPPFTGLATGAAPTSNQAINGAAGQQGSIMRTPFTGSMLYTSTPLTPNGGANAATTPRGLTSSAPTGGKFAFPSNPATPNSVFSPYNGAMAYEPHTANSIGSGVDEKAGGVGHLEYSPPMQYLQAPPQQQRPPYGNFQQPLPPAFMQQRAAPNTYASMTHMSPAYRLTNPGGAPPASSNVSASPTYPPTSVVGSPNTAAPVNPHDVPHVDDQADSDEDDDDDHDDEEEVDEEEEKQEDEDHNPLGSKKKAQSKNGKKAGRKGDKSGKGDSGLSAHDLKKQACTLCHHGKTSCDGQIPCSRCIRLGKADLCEERPRKEHYKKRQKREREEAQARREGRSLPPSSAERKLGLGAGVNNAASNLNNKAQMAAASALMGGGVGVHKKKDGLSAMSAAAGSLPPGAKPMSAVGIAAINAANASLGSMQPGAKLPGRLHGDDLPHALPIPLLAPQAPGGVVNVVSPSPLAVDMPSPMNHPLSITSLPPSVSTTPLRAGMPYLIRSDSGLSLKLPGDPSYTPGVAVGMPPPPGSSPPTVGLNGMTPTQMPLQPLPMSSPSGTSMLGNRVTHMLHTDRSPRMPTVAGPGGIMYGAVDPSSVGMPPPNGPTTVQTPNLLPNSMFLSPGFSPRRVGVPGVGNSPFYAAYVDPASASVADGRTQPMVNYFPGGRSPLQMGMNPNADGMGYSMPYRPSQQQQQEEAMFQQLLAQDNAAAEAKGQTRLVVPSTPGSITSNDMTSNTPNPNGTPGPPNAPGASPPAGGTSPLTRPNAVASLINAALTSAHPPRNVVPVTIVSGVGSPANKGLPPPMLPSMNSSPRVAGLGSPGMVGASVANGLPAAAPVVIPSATSINISGAKSILTPATSVSLLPSKSNGVVETPATSALPVVADTPKDHDMEVSTEDALRAASAVKVEQRLTTQNNRAVLPSTALSRQLVTENALSCGYGVNSLSTLPIGGGAITTLDTHMWSQVVLQYFRSSSIMSKLRLQLQRHQISQKRVQTYFAFLSEMLSEDEFKEVTAEMPMPIFCSTRASFAHQTFSPVFGAKYNQARIEGAESDASLLTPKNESTTLLPYHFNWQESPLTSVNDDPLPYAMSKGSSSKDTAGRGSVLATLQLRCRAGRCSVAHAGVAVAKFKSFKRRLTKRAERREKAKQKAKEKKEKEKRKKREQSRTRKKPRLAGSGEPVEESSAAAAGVKTDRESNGVTDSDMKDANEHATGNVSIASASDDDSDSSSDSDDSSVSTSSESDYSEYSRPSYGGDRSDSDVDDLNDLCVSGLVQHTSFAPFGGIPSGKDPAGEIGSNPSNHDLVRKLHENSCKFFKRYNAHPASNHHSSSSSSHKKKDSKSKKRRRQDREKDHAAAAEHQQASTPSTSSTSTSIPGIGAVNMQEDESTCNCPRVIERMMTIHVNREWERLFGYTQSDLRMIIMKEGIRRALSRLSVMEAAQTAFIHSTEALLGGVADYREYTTIVSKWGTQIQCLTHSTVIHSEGDGDVEGYMITWSILPPGSTSRSHYGAVSAAAAAAAGVGPAAPPMSDTTKTFFYSS